MPTTNGVTSGGGIDYGNTVFTNKQTQDMTSQDFLELMMVQLSNQDFMNPVDDTQFLSQMAQFTTMQQTQEMANLFKQSYVLSLVGQNVTAAKFKVNGEIDTATGIISKISLLDNEYLLYIGDKAFSLDQIMSLNAPGATDSGETQEPGNDYTQSGFLLSLMGKPVTVKLEGYDAVSGLVQKVSMDGLKFLVQDQWYTLEDLVSIDTAEEGPGRIPEEGGEGTE